MWKPQPEVHTGGATLEKYGPIPGSEILPYIYNYNKPGTKTVVPWVVCPARCGNPNLIFVEPTPPGENELPSNKPGTKTVVYRVDTAPHDVETPNWGVVRLVFSV